MSVSSAPQPFALYNPALLDPDSLLREFIARQPLLESLLDAIRQNQPGRAPQHLLLVGPRGMGKTTTLWAVAHRVNRDPALAKTWLPVVFDEESRRVGDLADFWLEAVRQWEHATQSPEDRTRPQPQDRINEHIRVPRVRLVDENGEQIGVKTTDEARDYAYGKGLDLVEVAPNADPPVARVMDYGKYKYEQEQKAKLARRARLDQANVSRIEAGRVRPYGVELRRLARALGLPACDAERLLDEVQSVDSDPRRGRPCQGTSA